MPNNKPLPESPPIVTDQEGYVETDLSPEPLDVSTLRSYIRTTNMHLPINSDVIIFMICCDVKLHNT